MQARFVSGIYLCHAHGNIQYLFWLCLGGYHGLQHSVQSTARSATHFLKAKCRSNKEDIVELVMFEDVDGMEIFVNPERVIWVREYPNHTTVISCGHEDRFAVRLAPAQAVAVLGKMVR